MKVALVVIVVSPSWGFVVVVAPSKLVYTIESEWEVHTGVERHNLIPVINLLLVVVLNAISVIQRGVYQC